MWDLIVSVPDHCLSFYFSCVAFHKKIYKGTNLLSADTFRIKLLLLMKYRW